MAELNSHLGRDQEPRDNKDEDGKADMASEKQHLYHPVDYENKIYFQYLLDRLAIYAEKRITHGFNFIGMIMKRCSFIGIYNQQEIVEMQQKKIDMLETQIKVLFRQDKIFHNMMGSDGKFKD